GHAAAAPYPGATFEQPSSCPPSLRLPAGGHHRDDPRDGAADQDEQLFVRERRRDGAERGEKVVHARISNAPPQHYRTARFIKDEESWLPGRANVRERELHGLS